MKNTASNIGIGLLGIMLIARVITQETPSNIRPESKIEMNQVTPTVSVASFTEVTSFSPLVASKSTPVKRAKIRPTAQLDTKVQVVQPEVKPVEVQKVATTVTTNTEKDSSTHPLDGRSTLSVNLSHHFPRKKINVKKTYTPSK